MTKREIPSAGPWITQKEVQCVADACEHGWYQDWHNYLDKFETAMCAFTQTKYALSTSSCTGALHLAMLALGIGPGDEVIVPETTWIASVTCVSYVGAKPVFVDVEPDTWCIDPVCVRKAITPRTRAIIPVHMYGHPANMVELCKIGDEYDLAVIEDAAPGIGSKINGRPTGSFGLAATFSFQGAKPLVMGEGGAIVTSDRSFYEKAYYYWDHCRAPDKVLYNTDIGYKYKLSNIQAALGFAQIERADEIIEKRREIFFWYKKRLQDIKGLRMNVERNGYFNSYYVPTIVLDGTFAMTAEELMDFLKAHGVASRPFFRCISKFPMFEPAETPVADHLAERGVNLPCASLLQEEDIDYVCSLIKKGLLK